MTTDRIAHAPPLRGFERRGRSSSEEVSPQRLIDHLGEGVWFGVEGGDRRGDHRAHFRKRGHGSQMTGVERRFAHEEDEPPAFLEHNIGCSAQQGCGHAAGDLGHAADRARGHHHPHRLERTGRDRRGQIADGVDHIGAAANRRRLEIGLERQCHFGGPADDKMRLDRQGPQQLEQPRPVDHTGGAADPDDQAGVSGHFWHSALFEIGRSVIFASKGQLPYGRLIPPALPSTVVIV